MLLVLAPQRHVLELWRVPYGQCCAEIALENAQDMVLLTAAAAGPAAHRQGCWLLDTATGQVHDLAVIIWSMCLT